MNTPHIVDQGGRRREGKRLQAHRRAYARGIVAVALLVLWALALLTGLLIALSLAGPRAGQLALGLMSRGALRDLHLWLGLLASALAILHVVLDWQVLLACLRHLSGNGHAGQETT